MAELKRTDVLLIVCKAINPFVDEPLLAKKDGELVPVAGAEKINIAGTLETLAAQDKKTGAHSVGFIRSQILKDIQDLGFGTALGPAVLMNGTFETIGALVDHLLAGAFDL